MTKAAGIIFLTKQGKVLFLQRSSTASDHPNEWAFPAGHVEDGEVEIQAAVREAMEETHIPAIDPMFLDTHKMDGVEFWTFTQDITEDLAPTLDGESRAYAWADPLSPPQPLHPGAAQALRALLNAFPMLDPRYVAQASDFERVDDIDEIAPEDAPEETMRLDLTV